MYPEQDMTNKEPVADENANKYLPKTAHSRRNRRRMLALTASIAACVCGILTASLVFRSTHDNALSKQALTKGYSHTIIPYQDIKNDRSYVELKEENQKILARFDLLNEHLKQKEKHLKEVKNQYLLQEKALGSLEKTLSSSSQRNEEHYQHLTQLLKELELTKKNLETELNEQKTVLIQKEEGWNASLIEKNALLENFKKDIASLNRLIKEKEEKITSLSSSKEESLKLQEELSTLSSDLGRQEEQNKTLNKKNGKILEEQEILTKRIETMEESKELLLQEIQNRENDIEHLTIEKEKLSSNLSELETLFNEEKELSSSIKENIEEKNSQISTLEEEKSHLLTGIEEQKKLNALSKEEKENLATEIEKYKREQEALAEALQEEKSKTLSLVESSNKQNLILEELKKEQEALSEILERKEQNLTLANEEKEQFSKEAEDLLLRLNSFKDLSNQYALSDGKHQETIKTLSSSLEKERETLSETNEKFLNGQEELLNLEKEFDALNDKYTRLKTKEEKWTDTKELLQSKVSLLEKEKKSLTAHLEKTSQEIQNISQDFEREKDQMLIEKNKLLALVEDANAKYTQENKAHLFEKKRFADLLVTLQTQKEMLETMEFSRKELANELENIRLAHKELLQSIALKTSPPNAADLQTIAAISKGEVFSETNSPQIHIVKKGETLSQISLKHYGTSSKWHDIFKANRQKIPNQNFIKPGTHLIIP